MSIPDCNLHHELAMFHATSMIHCVAFGILSVGCVMQCLKSSRSFIIQDGELLAVLAGSYPC